MIVAGLVDLHNRNFLLYTFLRWIGFVFCFDEL